MRKYVFHLYNYIFYVYAGRPGGYPEAFLKKKRIFFLYIYIYIYIYICNIKSSVFFLKTPKDIKDNPSLGIRIHVVQRIH